MVLSVGGFSIVACVVLRIYIWMLWWACGIIIQTSLTCLNGVHHAPYKYEQFHTSVIQQRKLHARITSSSG